MTNYVYLIAVPQDAGGVVRGNGEAHKRYSRMRNFDEGVRGYLFQGRFGACVLDVKHLVAAVRYVERNPVRGGVVWVAWEYPRSSTGYYVGERGEDVLVEKQGLWEFSGSWKEYVANGERRKKRTYEGQRGQDVPGWRERG
jgi:putative transposase